MSPARFKHSAPRTPFSLSTGYAVLALAALPEDGSYRMVRELGTQLGFPLPYLAKVLKRLRKMGLLESLRGPRGGFRLLRPLHQIALVEVVSAMDGNPVSRSCPLGQHACRLTAPCPFCKLWAPAFRRLLAALAQVSVGDLPPACRPAGIIPDRIPGAVHSPHPECDLGHPPNAHSLIRINGSSPN